MLLRIQAEKCLESLRRTADEIDSFGFSAWKRALDESKESMHEHGYQNRSGQLTASMTSKASEPRRFGWTGLIEIKAPHAQWVDRGTGIYGPFGTPIVPRVAPRLVFWWDKSRRWEFRRSVKGMPGAKFSQAAIDRFLAVAHAYVQAAVDSAVR